MTDPYPLEPFPWRTGRKVGRTIYQQVGPEPADEDRLIGTMDTEGLARRVVYAMNRVLDEERRRDQCRRCGHEMHFDRCNARVGEPGFLLQCPCVVDERKVGPDPHRLGGGRGLCGERTES